MAHCLGLSIMDSSFSFLQMRVKCPISTGKVKRLGLVSRQCINTSLQPQWKWGAVMFYLDLLFWGSDVKICLWLWTLSNSAWCIKAGAGAGLNNELFTSRWAIPLNLCPFQQRQSWISPSNRGSVDRQGKGTATKCYKGQVGIAVPSLLV